jgi:hypothetical protein
MSFCAEPFAAKKIFKNMLTAGIKIDVITTDRSSTLKKLFRYQRPGRNSNFSLVYLHFYVLQYLLIYWINILVSSFPPSAGRLS